MAIHGSGPAPATFLLLGSEPGFRDVRAGEVFSGPVGEEVRRLLDSCGVRFADVFRTNIYREPKDEHDSLLNLRLYEDGVEALQREIARVKPRHIITLGVEAARLFLGEDIDISEIWGLHLLPADCAWEHFPQLRENVSIFPQTSPGAGFHSPEASSQVLVGFENMRRMLRSKQAARHLYDDPIPNPDYRLLTSATETASWLGHATELAADTEGWLHAPWSLQLTQRAGEGVILRNDAEQSLRAVRNWLQRTGARVTTHSGLHDIGVMRQMGIDLVELGCAIDDTQLMAYLLGVIPQGLKALATRELGMPMQSYAEVLGKAADDHARTYLEWLWEGLNAKWQALRQEDFDWQRTVAKRRIKVLPKLPKSKLHKAVERVLGSKEPARLWGDQVLDLQVEAHRLMGPMPTASLSDVEPAVALRYAGRDPDATHRLKQTLWPRIVDMELEDVYALDLSTYPILDRMMQVGITPDIAAFDALAATLDEELAGLRTVLASTTGKADFNANSGDQVAAYLFETLQLDSPGKRLRGADRESTNDKVLEALEKRHPELPVIAQIRSYREYYKLLHTFVLRLPELTKRWPHDGRIHCELMLTRTPSGRLASKNPNLLAMPKHGKFAKAFRRCFVPGTDRLFLSADESQVELRVGAHLSQDPVMLAIYRGERRNSDGTKIDLHAAMCERVTGKKPKEQTSADRTAAKAINFGYWMGQTAIGLTLELRKGGMDIDEDDAQRWIDEADKLYVGAVAYKKRMVVEAQRHGYIRCLSGRIRYIGGIRSRDERVRAEAERFAYSTPVQEGAQWIGKRALARAWNDVYVPERRAGHFVEPLLWTHDDLLSEVDEHRVLDVARALHAILTDAPPGFSVPLETSPEAGENWKDLYEVEL